MPQESNVEISRRFIEAFNRRDLDAISADLTPDAELHEWPEAPGAQSYRGPDGVREALEAWFEVWEWMKVEIEDVVEAPGDRVLITLQQRAKGKGSEIEIEIETHNVYTFDDGKVTRLELFINRNDALEAAGLAANLEEDTR